MSTRAPDTQHAPLAEQAPPTAGVYALVIGDEQSRGPIFRDEQAVWARILSEVADGHIVTLLFCEGPASNVTFSPLATIKPYQPEVTT